AEAAVLRGEAGDAAGHRREGMHVGEDDVATRAQHAGELAYHGLQPLDVRERQRARDEIDARVLDGQRLELSGAELRARHLRARDRQHRLRRVDADYGVAELRKVRGVTAGAAGGVERDAD